MDNGKKVFGFPAGTKRHSGSGIDGRTGEQAWGTDEELSKNIDRGGGGLRFLTISLR